MKLKEILIAGCLLLTAPVMAFDSMFTSEEVDLRASLTELEGSEKKAVMIYFYKQDCPYCALLERNIKNKPYLTRFVQEKLIVVPMDVYGEFDIHGFNGEMLTEAEFSEKAGISSSPSVILLYKNKRPVKTVGMKSVQKLIELELKDSVDTGIYEEADELAFVEGYESDNKH